MDSNTINIDIKPLITEFGVAERLHISIATIRRWRLTNEGPKWLKLGRSVRYKQDDVDKYIGQCSDKFEENIVNREERAKKERERSAEANRKMYWEGQQ